MINAQTMGFAVRPVGTGVFFTCAASPAGKPVEKRLSDCTNATLKYRNQTVLVEGVATQNGQSFTGVVRGFEPAFVEEFDGMSIGEAIQFNEPHVFGASA